MEFSELVSALNRLRDTSLLRKPRVAKEILSMIQVQDIPQVVAIMSGSLFASETRLLSPGMVERALSSASGHSTREVGTELRRLGCLPHVAEKLLADRSQTGLVSQGLTVSEVLSEIEVLSRPNLNARAAMIHLTHLLARSEPSGARLIVELLLRQSSAYTPESILTKVLAGRVGVDVDMVHDLVSRIGWSETALALAKRSTSRPSDSHQAI